MFLPTGAFDFTPGINVTLTVAVEEDGFRIHRMARRSQTILISYLLPLSTVFESTLK